MGGADDEGVAPVFACNRFELRGDGFGQRRAGEDDRQADNQGAAVTSVDDGGAGPEALEVADGGIKPLGPGAVTLPAARGQTAE